MPPYLAGRERDQDEFRKLLGQEVILENMVLTGLRGVGKTVLLETFKPIAVERDWVWVGTDLSESATISESAMATRLIADLSVATSQIVIGEHTTEGIGFSTAVRTAPQTLDFDVLSRVFDATPGLASDKLKAVLELVWHHIKKIDRRGVVFAYDEAQNLADHAPKDEYPLSMLLDVFQSIQRKGISFMLVLTGLPTLFRKLVEARTFSERMFRVVFLDRLSRAESRDAVTKPVEAREGSIRFTSATVETVCDHSGGYPYFIQFICREIFDVFAQKISSGDAPLASMDAIIRKLDTDFFARRWARATDRQRALLTVIAHLDSSDREFTVQEIVAKSREMLDKPFSSSHANQMLSALSEAGLVFKNRHGRYSFAVPLLGRYILRQN